MANLCSLAAVGNFSKLDKDFSGSFSGTIVSYLEMKYGIGEPKDTSSHSSSPWGAWAVPALVPNPPEGQSSVWVDCHLTWPYFPRHVYLCIPSLCELHKQDQEMGRRQAWGVRLHASAQHLPFIISGHCGNTPFCRQQNWGSEFSWLPQVIHPIEWNS